MAKLTSIKRGLDILCMHITDDDDHISAEHDTIFFSGDRNTMTEYEIKELESLGFLWDDEFDCFFVLHNKIIFMEKNNVLLGNCSSTI